jgi:penicillin-binding protein-related factor A (putative recombinase)
MNSRLQNNLPYVNHRQSHGNLGKGFEDALDAAHEIYERQGTGKIIHIRNAFTYCTEDTFNRLDPYMRARLGTGLTMVREKTPWDFCGVVRGRAIAFDAKEFSGASIAVAELTPHQIEHLCAFSYGEGLAGFMIHAKRSGCVYWLNAPKAREMSDRACHARKGRVEGVLKSLNELWLSENALRVGRLPGDGWLNWAATLLRAER